jgi:hypothetical protein
MNRKHLRKKIQKATRNKKCVLCNRKPLVMGYFIPVCSSESEVSYPFDKFEYFLCVECISDSELSAQKVDDLITQAFGSHQHTA